MNRTIPGQGLEEKGGETGYRKGWLREARKNGKCEGLRRVMTLDNILTGGSGKHFDRRDGYGYRDWGRAWDRRREETRRELSDGKEIRSGTYILATYTYKNNPESSVRGARFETRGYSNTCQHVQLYTAGQLHAPMWISTDPFVNANDRYVKGSMKNNIFIWPKTDILRIHVTK